MSLIRHESRLIRPFLHAEEIKNILSGVGIRLKAGDSPMIHDAHVINPEDAGLLEPAISLAIDVGSATELLEKVGISKEAVKLALIATSHEMRLSSVLASYSLAELPDIEVDLSLGMRKFLSAKGGCEISVALLLSTELPPKSLKPHALGQWLAKKTFSLKPEQASNEFRILPLTDKDRERLRLPEGTVHFVEKGGSLNDPEAKLQDCLTIWVSEPIFNALSRDSASRASAAIQKAMLSEIILSVVVSEARDLDGGMPEEGSPLNGFFEDLAKSSKVPKEQLVQHARPNGDAPRLGAYVQQLLDLGNAMKAAL